MLASEISREHWGPFLDSFNRRHNGDRVRVERHQTGGGIIFQVEDCIFQRIHDDVSGDRHRFGVVVGEPNAHQETFLMSEPKNLLWYEEDEIDTLQIEGADGLWLVVRLLSQTKAAA